jgi:threonine dehydrogenase-like Zn-dependent dehydrogenase
MKQAATVIGLIVMTTQTIAEPSLVRKQVETFPLSAVRLLGGRIEPGRVFDCVIGLDGVPNGYRAMDERKAIKIMVKP